MEIANNQEINSFLNHQKKWKIYEKKLHRTFIFDNFIQAFSFMTQVAILAEKLNHHPEWSNVYKTVDIHLTTHEVGGISERDFTLAIEIDAIAAQFLSNSP